jgi:hypothetical protein
VRGTHLKRWTLRSMLVTDVRHRGVPWTALVAAGDAPPGELNLAPRHRASALLSLGLAGAVLARRPRLALAAAAGLVALNHDLYGLVARRRGPLAGALAPGLHALHHVSAAAAVPAGLVVARRQRVRRGQARRRNSAPNVYSAGPGRSAASAGVS